MNSRRLVDSDINSPLMNPSERRAAILREVHDEALERQERLASQTSPLASPEERIRVWERLHALSLPKDSAHKLVRIIATQTDVSIAQVQDEQRRRAGRLAPRELAPASTS